MSKTRSDYFRLVMSLTGTTMMTFALSSCSFDGLDKSTSFNKNLDSPSDHSQVKTSPDKSATPSPTPSSSETPSTSPSPIQSLVSATPAPQPAPVTPPIAPPTKSVPPKAPPAPAPVAPPAEISSPSASGDFSGNYVSSDSDLEMSSSKDFVIHSQALAALSASANSQKLCKIEREGTIQSIDTDGANPAIHFNITSEKFSAVQSGSADENFCAEVGKSFSEPHSFNAPIEAAGKGYLALNLDEASSDGVSLTTNSGLLSDLFFDRDSATNITQAILQILPANYNGAFGGGFLANLPVPRLTFNLDSKSEKFTLVDNECAFSITGPLNAAGSSNSVLLTAPSSSLSVETLTSAAEKTYSVYFGRLSGGCTQRKQNFISQLTGSGIKFEDAAEPGKYALDFTATGGPNSKYTIRSN
jgi:hypothetical protein